MMSNHLFSTPSIILSGSGCQSQDGLLLVLSNILFTTMYDKESCKSSHMRSCNWKFGIFVSLKHLSNIKIITDYFSVAGLID